MTTIEKPEPFERGDLATINQDHRQSLQPDNCPVCKVKVILHCSRCKTQVTSCQCLLHEQLGQELGEAELRRLEDESRRDRMRHRGFRI